MKIDQLSPQEQKILARIRDGEYTEVKIRKTNGKVSLLELTSDTESFSRINEVIREGRYQDLKLTQVDGKVVRMRRTIKERV